MEIHDENTPNWSAIERMWPCQDYGVGFWRYVSPNPAERNKLWQPPPSDGKPRWSASGRNVSMPEGVVCGEFTAKEPAR